MREKKRTEHSYISLNENFHRQEEGEASGTRKRTYRTLAILYCLMLHYSYLSMLSDLYGHCIKK